MRKKHICTAAGKILAVYAIAETACFICETSVNLKQALPVSGFLANLKPNKNERQAINENTDSRQKHFPYPILHQGTQILQIHPYRAPRGNFDYCDTCCDASPSAVQGKNRRTRHQLHHQPEASRNHHRDVYK